MDHGMAISWFLTLAPLSISPGPANVLFAASGGAFGVRATLPFWLGTNLVCVFQSLAVGLGFMTLLDRFPGITAILQYAGIVVLLYLALRFFRSAISTRNISKPLSFGEGVFVQLLNAKFLLIPTVMFSQFHASANDAIAGLVLPILALTVLTMISNLIWILGGRMLTSMLAKEKVARYQGHVFGGILVATALWLILRTVHQ